MKVATLFRSIGARADVERYCPHLYTTMDDGSVQEAILDVVAVWPGLPVQHCIDVIIHSAFATSLVDAASKPGIAALGGERQKRTRYGSSVLPFSMETLGRLGTASLDSLDHLSGLARTWGRVNGIQHWRRALEHVVLWELADAAMLAVGQ